MENNPLLKNTIYEANNNYFLITKICSLAQKNPEYIIYIRYIESVYRLISKICRGRNQKEIEKVKSSMGITY